MKNTTLLKVLSATAIFSAIAAIESYDQDNFAFAAETPVVASNPATATASTDEAEKAEREKLEAEKAEREKLEAEKAEREKLEAEKAEREKLEAEKAEREKAEAARLEKEKLEREKSTTAPTTSVAPTTPAHNAEEPATVAQDVKALKDGEYKITAEALKFYEEGQPSMAAAAIDNDKTKLIVKNGQYSVNVSFKPITFGGLTGYLGDLKYYDGDKTHENRKDIQKNEFKDSTIVENYSANETDKFVDAYKKQFPNRTVYPKTVAYNVDKNKIDSNNKLETYTQVFVPVMASINETLGTQNMILKFDFSTLTAKNSKQEESTNPTYVKLHIKDNTIATPKVRKNVDTIAKIVKESNQEYLIFNYYSKVGKGKNNDGLQNIKYSYKEIQKAKDSELLLPVSNRVIETINTTDSVYEISEAKIPITNKKEVVIYGDFQYPAAIVKQYGTITWDDKNVVIKNKSSVEPPELFSIKAALNGTTVKKTSDPNQEFDFSKDGINYSPYNGLSGKKFKLAKHYYHSIDVSFKRDNLINTLTRYIKYTIDGSEPTFQSADADIKFANANPHKPEFYYGININPFENGTGITSNGGNLTLKVKAFNIDGSKSSETKTYILPFEKETLDKAETTLNINNKEYTATLSSKNKFLLDEDVVIKTTPVSERIMNHTLDSKVQELGLTKVNSFKFDLTKKDGSKFTPLDKDGWNINENPIFTLNIAGYEATANTQVYIYENGILRLIPSTPSKKGVEFNVNSDEAYFVIAEKDSQILKKEKIMELNNKVSETEKILSDTSTISTAKANLEAELEKIKITLARPKASLSNIVLHLENLDINLKKLKSEKNTDLKYLQNNFENLTNIVNSDILSQLLTKEKLEELKALVSKTNNSLNDALSLQNNIKELYESLNNLSYKYPTQDIDYSIKKFYRPDETSMANNVFTNKGKLIYTPTKTYLEIDLKTMLFGNIHSHLLEIDVFKNKLDEEKFNYSVVNKYDDLNSLTGEIGNFNKKLIIELEKEVKNSYDIRVPNDGMGNSRPEAKLVITTNINRPEVLSDAEKLAKEKEEAARLEKERLEKEAAAKVQAEKERLEKEAAAKAQAEKERLEKEVAAKAQEEKEKLAKEKEEAARLEKERLEKEAAAKAQAEKEKLAKENAEKARIEAEILARKKVETEKLEKLKSETVYEIMKDNSISNDEKEKLKAIINNATLKDTLVASISNDDKINDITVSFNNTDIKATQFIAVKADEESATKVESLVKNTDKNMQVIKTIDLYFKDKNGNIIDKKVETRTVTVALLANENEKLEVYYVNDNNLEKIPSIYKDGKLTFFTNHFSLYTIIKNVTTNQAASNINITSTNTPTSYKDNALVQSVLPEFNKNSLTNNTDSEATKSNVQEIKHVATNNKTLAKTGTTTTATGFLGLISLLSAVTLRRKTNK